MKTVYILGAGFSIPCGAPSQASIIDKILKIETSSRFKSEQKKIIKTLLKQFKSFALDNFLVDETQLSKLALEDIFTPLDRCIIEDISFRDVDPKKLIECKENLNTLIAAAISENIHSPNQKYIQQFASYKIISRPIEEIKVKEFLTVRDLAKLLNSSPQTIYRLIKHHRIKAINLADRKTLIKRSEIDQLFIS